MQQRADCCQNVVDDAFTAIGDEHAQPDAQAEAEQQPDTNTEERPRQITLDELAYRRALRDLLEMRYGLPVHVLNDSQAAAMGEYFFGASHETGNLVVIKCEEGVGAGTVLEGRLLQGDNFGAGEIGHLVFAE